jgi:serine/threonine-protein kinase ULK4
MSLDRYHIYEAIGKGKHSTVYKGRRKKSIQYYAIKSVEKGQRQRVMQEVAVLRTLSHENVLKFVAWYETQNHLWVILEYCVGGDLLLLLRQDLKLPEPSITTFARDMFVAVREIHSKGLIHCDLKPSNMLLDEEGRIKVCGFGLSRKITAVATANGTPAQLSRRGTPCYMAPEMFTPEGVHSFATDLWALGCVLYECATGRPPFTSTSLTSLIEQILEHEPSPLPSSCSASFKSLVFGLLIKRPHARLTWEQVIHHEFWTERGGEYKDDVRQLSSLRLPPQTAFDALAAKLKSEDLAARLKMLGSVRDSGSAGAADLRKSFMPSLTQSLRDSVNVLRLSRIARSNLEREEAGTYGPHGATPEGKENAQANAPEDVELENPDAELNFATPTGDDEEDDMEVLGETIIPTAPKTPPRRRGGESFGDENRAENFTEPAESFEDADEEHTADDTRVVLTPPAADAMLVDSRSPVATTSMSRSAQTADEDFGDDVSSSLRSAETPALVGRPESRRPTVISSSAARKEVIKSIDYSRFEKLCTHSSDLIVRPIILNRRIEVVQEAPHDPDTLPFKAISVSEMLATSQTELEAFLTRVYRSVAHPSPIQEKVNTLAYFETLCSDTSSANVLVNSSLMSMFVRVLGSSKAPSLRIRLCSIMGLLMRHATHIGDELAKSEAVKVLADTMSDTNERVRRRAMATLGELLFYVATQQRPDAAEVWGVTDSVIEVFIRTLKYEEDEITKHYACKTIENIVSHEGASWSDAFTECRTAILLFAIVLKKESGDQIRGTAASALSRSIRCNANILHPLVGEVDNVNARDGLIGMLRDSEAKVQQSGLNILNYALIHEESRSIATTMEEQTLLPVLTSLFERSQTTVIKAKALLSMALLIRLHPKWLLAACGARVLAMIDRRPTDMDKYLAESYDAFVITVVSLVPRVNGGILGEVERLMASKEGEANHENAGAALKLFPVLVHLLGSSTMRPKVLDDRFLADVARYLNAAETEDYFPGRDELRVGVLSLLETCSQYADEVLLNVDAVTVHFLPALCDLLASSTSADTRFLALKLICDILLPLRLDLDIAVERGLRREVVAHRLDALIMEDLLPMCPSLIESEDPIPLYALKLLSGTLEIEPALCREVIALGLAPQFFEFLSLDHTNNNVHNVRLCLTLARSTALSTRTLWDYKAPEKVAAVLSYTHQNNVGPFVEPALGIAATLLRRARNTMSIGASTPPSEITTLLDLAPILRQLAATVTDGALARDLILSLDAFNAH